MSLPHLIRAALAMPPKVAAVKAWRFASRLLAERFVGRLMRRQCTYPDPPAGMLHRRLSALDPAVLARHAEPLRKAARQAASHRFDLLGSGLVRVAHGERYGGFGPWRYGPGAKLPPDWRGAIAAGHWRGNQAHAVLLLSQITDDSYRPIDWQVDFKSGYRWSVRHWAAGVPYGHKPGIDIKLPWELARLQHLPVLALSYAADPDARLADEFRHQALDFLASNPPGWGVNWACAMDVAIRAANLILAWDLFHAHGAGFPALFEEEFAAALLAHGRHIARHLEWSERHRANHYLADIAGLTLIAATLPRSTESDLWLAFCAQQLEAEILRQFGADGGNFEGSVAYHRLSLEMAQFAVAAILGLPADKRAALTAYDAAAWGLQPKLAPGPMAWPPFSAMALERLARARRFAQDATKPSGRAVQIGDNDSGRFVVLTPERPALDLSHLWTGSLENAVLGPLPLPPVEPAHALPANGVEGAAGTLDRLVVAPADPTALDGLEAFCYPDFGLFIWKNARAFVAVRCGAMGGNGLGAHAHNDQLAVEIEIDGEAFAQDPGSFVYTPDLKARNAYRSALAHAVPRHGAEEPARLDLGPFRLEDRAQARALVFAEGEFLGRHDGFGETVWRRVMARDGAVVIEDCRGGPLIAATTVITEKVVRSPDELAAHWQLSMPFSPGYGQQQ